MRLRPLPEEAFYQMFRTSRRQHPATVWIKGGTVLDVYTKSWKQANVVISGERIAYVGETEPLTDESTQIIDASGQYLVPGYIEPHAHPMQWYSLGTLSDYALQCGTTMMVTDTMQIVDMLEQKDFIEWMERHMIHPVKNLFWARLDPQTVSEQMRSGYTKERFETLLNHPLVIQSGELTDWSGILAERDEMMYGLRRSLELGKRIEGHHPGASPDTLNMAAAIGVGACHESIKAEEVLHRLSLGMYATLRHSSIRPDLPTLVKGLMELGVPWSSRMMLTSDGSTPPMMRHGFMDYTIRVAIEAGMPPIEAYVMATLNPAVYYHLDQELGGIAPGRIADILFLSQPDNPTPVRVIANGQLWAENGQLITQPPKLGREVYPAVPLPDIREQIQADWFRIPATDTEYPVMDMLNAVITKEVRLPLPADAEGFISLTEHPELALIALIDRQGTKLTHGIVRGFGNEIEAIATTYHASDEYLMIGRNPESMAQALQRVITIGGGVVMLEQGQSVFEMPLPIIGKVTDAPMEEVISQAERFEAIMRDKGYSHLDPIYSLLFFTATHLPFLRITIDGLYDVKKAVYLSQSRQIK
ncbi:adenine deaminase C-terminal domain-containing protein [Brevibacillus dissolubilis]|uniref:adenine deaminase C-terminal domain-containing protein n=1 Tax=Brevibacillus dissolubilis TaxID=1844116 RepID=UPI00111798AF|nr:adenine deaminase C-terminal domain-containing protein [Brevibacillus dissolubilis]